MKNRIKTVRMMGIQDASTACCYNYKLPITSYELENALGALPAFLATHAHLLPDETLIQRSNLTKVKPTRI